MTTIERFTDWDDESFPETDSYHCEDVVVDWCIVNNIIILPDSHQYNHVPVFDDDTCARFTLRMWGALMADVAQHFLPNERFNYLDFYVPNEAVLDSLERQGVRII